MRTTADLLNDLDAGTTIDLPVVGDGTGGVLVDPSAWWDALNDRHASKSFWPR